MVLVVHGMPVFKKSLIQNSQLIKFVLCVPAMFRRDWQGVWPGLGRHSNFHSQLLGTLRNLKTKNRENGGNRKIFGKGPFINRRFSCRLSYKP